MLNAVLYWLHTYQATLKDIAAPFGLVGALAGCLFAGVRVRKWWVGRRAHVRKLLDFLAGEPVLYAGYACETPGPTYGAAQKIRDRIGRMLPKVESGLDRQDFEAIREASISLKNSFPNARNLPSSGLLSPPQIRALQQARETIAKSVESLCCRNHIEIPDKFLPYISPETRTALAASRQLKAVMDQPAIAVSRDFDVDQQLAIFNKPGAIIRVKWELAKRYGSTEYGTVISAYKSTRLYAEKDHICIVFTNAATGETETALLDADSVELIANPIS